MNSFFLFILIYKIPFCYGIREKIDKVIFNEPIDLDIQSKINMEYYKKITSPIYVDENFVVVNPDGTTKDSDI